MGMLKYILEGHQPVPVEETMEGTLKWGKWFETAQRHVAETHVTNKVYVSTVFLGMDHNFFDDTPILFETMIFGGALNGYQERYHTWDEAEEGHKVAVAKASHAVWQKLRKCKNKKFDSSFTRMLESRETMKRLDILIRRSA